MEEEVRKNIDESWGCCCCWVVHSRPDWWKVGGVAVVVVRMWFFFFWFKKGRRRRIIFFFRFRVVMLLKWTFHMSRDGPQTPAMLRFLLHSIPYRPMKMLLPPQPPPSRLCNFFHNNTRRMVAMTHALICGSSLSIASRAIIFRLCYVIGKRKE